MDNYKYPRRNGITVMELPVIIINFKDYETTTGKNALKIARMCDRVAKQTGASIALAVQAADIYKIAKAVKIPVLAQHIDSVSYGKHTGFILAESVKEAGAVGTILNHSEHQIAMDTLGKSIASAKRAGLLTVACADTAEKAAEVAGLSPDFVAVEPPELIGGDISVSTAKPELISETAARVRSVADIPLLCGAGVKTGADIKAALSLGARGFLLASGITEAKNPRKMLLGMVSGLK